MTVSVTAAALAAELADPNPPFIFDATLVLRKPRHDGDFTATSGVDRWANEHIPGSRHVAIDTDFSVPHPTQHDRHPEPQQLADRLAAFGVGATDRVVTYDTVGGLWAARLWYLLDTIGADVRVLDGGLHAWRESGGNTVASHSAPSVRPATPWQAQAVRPAWIELEEITTRTHPNNLVCALSRESFAGTEPTRYSRRGHIPSTSNVPARELFTATGRLRPADEIIKAFRDAGVDLNTEVLLYCGGGISATASALALRHAGVTHLRVYDGSLEEWSANPSLPLSTLAATNHP
ncbi:sulfurtransferase [Microbacterium azadirachtae]|uniref:Thiosulfate/3-mercaptopyruvate sulfurtransferase n=1 Tax=Microbacterium azadirachtae TaxID=582680 RepID=A0A1I6G8L7_9MICO|nr:rhodanese-like domain-containing protein [Microbacterium azadirachtae]SDL37642.1 thiosulfate/3-mercaptopyruvate sulfurtransferase [Microbacterium azadirachtae]SEF68599.1 thiosulfate/3-mercaptopyruvate sulfurtransferase [Microbacterium azadirachtae]SEF69270.1 thiosulfate/3-mercaptopyruvate sulfurtransferase [Microbacterium azadirachtae]SFR38533.1 thiosulfate/3-mercaptopyruvate sulfurtransferase [Microbacterium azadirachtae]